MPKKSKKDILKSINIQEIEQYLQNSHPDDPKRSVLKPKLIALKNEEWTKGKKNAKPMEARPVIMEIPNKFMRHPNSEEAEEFKKLISLTSAEHKEKTVNLLNAMFDEDISSKEAIFLLKNNSDCNLVVRIQGNDFYNLAVPAHGENFIVINKGSYNITANVCDIKYSSQKEIKKGIFVVLDNPVSTDQSKADQVEDKGTTSIAAAIKKSSKPVKKKTKK